MSLKAKWERDQATIGFFCMIPSGFTAEIIADIGYDFVIIDAQHGLIGQEATVQLLQAVSRTPVAPLVRVPGADPARIGACLDAGAAGVIVPMVNGRSDAEGAVSACRYPPEGQRSWGPVRASMLRSGDIATLNRDVVCIVMIETAEAVEAAEEICACPGVDAVFIGWADLAISMGLPIGSDAPALRDAIAHVREICEIHGIVAAIPAQPENLAQRVDEGFRMFIVGSDYQTLRTGARRAYERARSSLGD